MWGGAGWIVGDRESLEPGKPSKSSLDTHKGKIRRRQSWGQVHSHVVQCLPSACPDLGVHPKHPMNQAWHIHVIPVLERERQELRSLRLRSEFKGILGYKRPYLKNKQSRNVSKTSMNQCESWLDRETGKSPRLNQLLGAWKTCLPLPPMPPLFPGHSHLLCISDLLNLFLDKPKSLQACPQMPPPVSSQLVGS